MALIHPEVAALQRSPSSAYLTLIVSLCGGGMKERVCFLQPAALPFVGLTLRYRVQPPVRAGWDDAALMFDICS